MFSNVFFFYFTEVDHYLHYSESTHMVIEFYLNSLVYIDQCCRQEKSNIMVYFFYSTLHNYFHYVNEIIWIL